MKKFLLIIAIVAVVLTIFGVKLWNDHVKVQSWNFSEWAQATYDTTTTIEGLTIYAAEGKTMAIDSCDETIDGKKYTKCLKFGGASGWDEVSEPQDRILSFDVVGPTEVKIAFSSASGSGSCISLYDSGKYKGLDQAEAPADGIGVCTLVYDGFDPTGLLVGVDGAIDIYYIKARSVWMNDHHNAEELDY